MIQLISSHISLCAYYFVPLFHSISFKAIYTALNEPDGVAGVDRIRERPASLHQQAIVWENVGMIFMLFSSLLPFISVSFSLEFLLRMHL